MSASDLAQRLDYPQHPYAELECIDYLVLRRTKARLDTARQEVETEYENLSKCHLDNMTYAKAQLDHARQKEKDCFKDFERAHNHAVAAISRFVRATPNDDELEDESDTSILGLVPKARTARIRAPTRATAGPSQRVTKHVQTRATAPGSLGVSDDPGAFALASRAMSDVSFKALLRIVATGNASDRQMHAFQKVMDELGVAVNSTNAQAASQMTTENIKQEGTSDS
jgi:hypothetical protein